MCWTWTLIYFRDLIGINRAIIPTVAGTNWICSFTACKLQPMYWGQTQLREHNLNIKEIVFAIRTSAKSISKDVEVLYHTSFAACIYTTPDVFICLIELSISKYSQKDNYYKNTRYKYNLSEGNVCKMWSADSLGYRTLCLCEQMEGFLSYVGPHRGDN